MYSFRAVAVCLIILCLTACGSYKELKCTSVDGFKVSKINTEGIEAEVLITIQNPNKVGFSIYKSVFDITYSGIHVGKARLLNRVHISASSEETYSFIMNNDFKDVNLLDVLKLLSDLNFKNTFEVKGDLYVGKFFLKKKIPVNLVEKIGER